MAQPPRPAQRAGAPSPRDHFAAHVNRNNMIPVWLHPDLARGVINHYGRSGQALVHPHPSTGYDASAYQNGGTVQQPAAEVATQPRDRMTAAPGGPPAAGARPMSTGVRPMAGIPGGTAAARPDRSIFAGGPVGTGGPVQRTPIFAKKGAAIDGRGGTGRVPGKPVPASQKSGHDTVHAMLDAGEMVANKKQLKGLQVRPGKGHLLRADQKKALKQAHGRGRK